MSKIVYEIQPKDVTYAVIYGVPGEPSVRYGTYAGVAHAIDVAKELAGANPDHYVLVERRP